MTTTQHGTRSAYVTGCRCPECRLAESNYQKGRRRRGIKPKAAPRKSLASAPVSSISAETPAIPSGPGRVESAVIAEIAMLSTASKRPGLVEAALSMGRLLDNPLNSCQHPQACARLQNALAELRIGADLRKGWLSEVRQMSGTAG
jgi:hypothetical protein